AWGRSNGSWSCGSSGAGSFAARVRRRGAGLPGSGTISSSGVVTAAERRRRAGALSASAATGSSPGTLGAGSPPAGGGFGVRRRGGRSVRPRMTGGLLVPAGRPGRAVQLGAGLGDAVGRVDRRGGVAAALLAPVAPALAALGLGQPLHLGADADALAGGHHR